jgi:hypothetical protein
MIESGFHYHVFCSAGRRPGVCTLSDRQVTFNDLQLASSKNTQHSTDVAWSAIPVGCSWLYLGMAAERSGSHHANHM